MEVFEGSFYIDVYIPNMSHIKINFLRISLEIFLGFFPSSWLMMESSLWGALWYAEVAAGQLKAFLVGYCVMLAYVVVSQISLQFLG